MIRIITIQDAADYTQIQTFAICCHEFRLKQDK